MSRITHSPLWARAFPFAAFALLTLAQGRLGEASQFWVYALKTIVGAWLLWQVRRAVPELRWNLSWEGIAVGFGVFAAWVGLDPWYPKLAQSGTSFNPHQAFGDGSVLAWAFIAVRMIGSSLVVAPLEEVFYRSFLYRYLIRHEFLQVPLERLDWKAFGIAAAVFGVAHYEWLPGIICAMAYQGLVVRKKRLGDAITAHAITNLLLGFWVILRPAWQFW